MNNKARVGFYKLPTRALGLTELDYEKVTISGAGFREPKKRKGEVKEVNVSFASLS